MSISWDVNVENEQVVLGSLLRDAEQRRRWLTRLRDEDFLDPVHRDLLAALRRIGREGLDYATDTVVQMTGDTVKYKYLRSLEEYDALPDANLEVHVGILRREFAKDRAREAFEELYGHLDDSHSPLGAIETAAAAILRAVRDPNAAGRRGGLSLQREWYGDLKEAAAGRLNNFRPLHFSGLDEELYEGLKPGNVVVVASRPGMGKTTLCSNLLLRQTLRGAKWLSVPAEPGTETVVEQMTCARVRISAEKLIKTPDQLTPKDLFEVNRASREILGNGLLEIDDAISSFDELEAITESTEYAGVLVDLWEYLLDDLDPKVVTQMLRRLKRLAKRRGFCAVIVHQIKRIKRIKNPRPQLHELKNSGGYEEVADLVLLLHRAKYYNKDVERDILEIDVAKQRRGPQNVRVGFEFDPICCRVGKHVPDFDPRDLR